MPAAFLPLPIKFLGHPGTAVTALVPVRVDCSNLSHQSSVLSLPTGFRPSLPRVVGATRNAEHSAENLDRVIPALLRDKPKSYFSSLAKKAVAFFRFHAPSPARGFFA